MKTCTLHHRTGITHCQDCAEPVCEQCRGYVDGRDVCPRCAGRRSGRRWLRRAALAVVGVAAAVGATWVVAHRDRWARSLRRHPASVSILEYKLEHAPCDAAAAVDLARALIVAGASDEVRPMAEAFTGRCGRRAPLLWKVYAADKELGDWQHAILVATDLIEHDPGDKDYWWWRGIVYEQLGDLDRALADYQQTLALQPDIDAIPFNLADLHERRRRPCDAALALQQYVHWHPESLQDANVQRRIDRLQRDGRCGDAVEGTAVVRFPPGSRVIPAEATVQGARGRFLVDTGASVVTLTRAFAARAGVAAGGPTVQLATAGGLTVARRVQLDSMSLQGARARAVEAAVVEALPGGYDGLVGLSFLSRFELQLDAAAGRLELAARAATRR